MKATEAISLNLDSPDLWRGFQPLRFYWTEGPEILPQDQSSELVARRPPVKGDMIFLRSLQGEAKNLQSVQIMPNVASGPWGAIDDVLTPKGATFGVIFRPALCGILSLRPDIVRLIVGSGPLEDRITDVYDGKGARAAVVGKGEGKHARYDLLLAAKTRWLRERYNVKLLSLAKDEKL